jgi:hypothetical protein
MASKRVRPVPSSGTGHTDSGGYAPGPFGPEFGAAGSFDVSDQFKVRRSASQPAPRPRPQPGLWYWMPKGGA